MEEMPYRVRYQGERDALASHGASLFLREKFFNHSDGYTEYICRCGKPAIANKKEKIYKCKSCKDNADIAAVQTSWTSKLFCQEMQACHIGVRRSLRPYNYAVNDNEYDELSKFEEYSTDTLLKLNSQIEDTIDDSSTQVEAD